jgi:hypothetical protein
MKKIYAFWPALLSTIFLIAIATILTPAMVRGDQTNSILPSTSLISNSTISLKGESASHFCNEYKYLGLDMKDIAKL